ncbi:MAG: 4-hydroxy-tetrahydrodipicolinate synthase [Actinobacteria bacterium]|nr:4-hydroxy-tetrahydrodipicolinate synthase [Actinomycetota bacterium]
MGSRSFGEVITAMVTPFDKGDNLDFEAADRLMDHLIKTGSDSILLSGTTGESPVLTDSEKIELFKLGVKKCSGKAKVIAGTGSNDTRHSQELSKEAELCGVDCILLVTPYYNKPGQAGLYRHFEEIAASVKIPVILYNVPSRTCCNLGSKTCIELSRIENIIAVKEASSDFRQIAEIIRAVDDFAVYSGNDGDTLPMLSLGAFGVISVASHLVGNHIKKMITQFKQGNVSEAAELHNWLLDIFYGIFITTNPVPIKHALNLAGITVGSTRLPLSGMSAEELESLKKILSKYNLI